MTDKIQLLLELQELSITVNETQILHGDSPETDEAEARRAELRAQIDADSLAKYDRLAQLGLAVVEVNGSMCLGCHMSIPPGDLNRMLKNETTPACPNCGRFLNLDAAK